MNIDLMERVLNNMHHNLFASIRVIDKMQFNENAGLNFQSVEVS
jgi:hypothetical protein